MDRYVQPRRAATKCVGASPFNVATALRGNKGTKNLHAAKQ